MDDHIGAQILDCLNALAQQCNGAYDQINTRNATVEQVRARVSLMRHDLDMIEAWLLNNSILKGV